MKIYKIALLPGDGIGPEVCGVAVKILQKIEKNFPIKFEIAEKKIGGAAIEKFDEPLPRETLQCCENSDAILFGSVGDPKFDGAKIRPETAILDLRKYFNFFANIRPAGVQKNLRDFSPLKNEIIGDGFYFKIVRELCGGIYFGKKISAKNFAADEMKYEKFEIERIARVAFNLAKNSAQKKVTNVDKANVLATSKFWRKIVAEIHAKEFPEIALENLFIDNATMQILKNPKNFSIILTANLFGDILSDEAAQISGSIGMSASASLNEKNFGLFEPIGGSAPDIAGKNVANPIAQIFSAKMMLEHFGEFSAAEKIAAAVDSTLKKFRTPDIFVPGTEKISTQKMGDEIAARI